MVEFTGVTITICGGSGDPIYNGEIQYTMYIHCMYIQEQCHVYELPLSVMGSLNGPIPLTLTAATSKA